MSPLVVALAALALGRSTRIRLLARPDSTEGRRGVTDTLFNLPPGGVVRKAARRHVLLPSMGFACGRVMLDDDCLDDPWVMSANEWCWVTCPECIAVGRREVRRLTHRQQRPEQHVCDDTCAWTSEPADTQAGAA